MLDIEHIAGTGVSVGTLANGATFVIDTADIGLVDNLTWTLHTKGYLSNRKLGFMHRLILKPAKGMLVDHKNHDKGDNRRCNIRPATYSQNGGNRLAQKSSGTSLKGVFSDGRGRYKSRIVVNGVKKHLGMFKTQEAAHAAYSAAAITHFGEFACT